MIHVLTLTWNGLDKLTRLKDGLFRNLNRVSEQFNLYRDSPTPFRWYIRDNGSSDDTQMAVQEWENTQLLAMSHNRDNFAKGMNSLAALTNARAGDFFLLLNNDVEFADDESLTNMLDLLISVKASAVGARLLYNGTTKLQHAGVIFGERYGGMPYHYRHKEESDAAATKNRYFQAVTAAVCLVEYTGFRAVGGFDEKFSWAFDDIDLCLRLRALGPIAYCGQTNIYHEESASLKKNPVNKLFQPNNVSYFKAKWNGKYDMDHNKYLMNPEYNVIK